MPIPKLAPFYPELKGGELFYVLHRHATYWDNPEDPRVHKVTDWETGESRMLAVDWREPEPFEATLIFRDDADDNESVVVEREKANELYHIPLRTLSEWARQGIIEGGAIRGVFRVFKGKKGFTLQALNYLPPLNNANN